MIQKIIVSVTLLVTILVSSCSKPLDPMETIDVTKNAYLKDRTWKRTSHSHIYDMDAAMPLPIDSLAGLPNCRQDDYLDIRSTSTGFINDYFIKCLVDDAQETPIFYTITENDSYIKIYTDPTNPDGSILLQGYILTPTINKFQIIYKYWNTAKEKNETGTVTYENFIPDF